MAVAVMTVTLLAFGLRLWQLNQVPPGWRDDELINSLVISQKALDGDWSVYYPDASGHEALYHWLSAGTLGLFGPGIPGIRLLPAVIGTLTVPLTYAVARLLLGKKAGLVAAMALALSFWSLMYSRIGIRHISLPLFMLAAFFFFLRGLGLGDTKPRTEDDARSRIIPFLLSGFALGLSFYTYFASRGTPLILVAFILYLAVVNREQLRGRVGGVVLLFAVALLMVIPLLFTLLDQPAAEARVEQLAVPLIEARSGNFQPLMDHVFRTLSMVHSGGDEEWLYNIPFRPVFGPVGAILFWTGVLICVWHVLYPGWIHFREGANRKTKDPAGERDSMASAFLLTWWLVGVSPAFISIPPASLGHTIIAQSAVYCLAAVPIAHLIRASSGLSSTTRQILAGSAVILFLVSVAGRDLPDYFQRWPDRGMTRFLYRADIKDLAAYLRQQPELTDFGVTGFLAGPWDRLALEIDLQAGPDEVRPRWYDPRRSAMLQIGGQPALNFIGYPVDVGPYANYFSATGETIPGSYLMVEATNAGRGVIEISQCFEVGLCLLSASYDKETGLLDLYWQVDRPLSIPARPLISNPPPPGIYAGPRLQVFSHLVDDEGNILSNDDGLWVDVATLHTGDMWVQRHRFDQVSLSGARRVLYGLYDPMTGARVLTSDGQDHGRIELE